MTFADAIYVAKELGYFGVRRAGWLGSARTIVLMEHFPGSGVALSLDQEKTDWIAVEYPWEIDLAYRDSLRKP
jgi:hypothetical protein